MTWDDYIKKFDTTGCTEGYLRFARVRYELEELAGGVFVAGEPGGYVVYCSEDKGFIQFLKSILANPTWEGEIKSYCLKELRRVYGRS